MPTVFSKISVNEPAGQGGTLTGNPALIQLSNDVGKVEVNQCLKYHAGTSDSVFLGPSSPGGWI